MNKMSKYKDNLLVSDQSIFSYHTRVANIDHKNKTIKPLGHWSRTTSKHINYVAKEYGYKVEGNIKSLKKRSY